MATYKAIMDDVRIPLRDASKGRLDDTKLLSLLNRVVNIAYNHVAKIMPELIWKNDTIALTTTTGYGPYNLPDDVLTICAIYDDQQQPKPLDRTSREKSQNTQLTAQPRKYWLEGFDPFKCYFESSPDQDRDYEIYYIPKITRETDDTKTLPLPDFLFFDMLVELLVKFAGSVDEYITTDEDNFITIITSAVDGILLELKAPREISFEDYGL